MSVYFYPVFAWSIFISFLAVSTFYLFAAIIKSLTKKKVKVEIVREEKTLNGRNPCEIMYFR